MDLLLQDNPEQDDSNAWKSEALLQSVYTSPPTKLRPLDGLADSAMLFPDTAQQLQQAFDHPPWFPALTEATLAHWRSMFEHLLDKTYILLMVFFNPKKDDMSTRNPAIFPIVARS
jgi:hypothetical protein